MFAAKVLAATSRLPGIAGESLDAFSAHTQVRINEAPGPLYAFENGMPTSLDDTSSQPTLSEMDMLCHPLTGLLWERMLLNDCWGESSELGVFDLVCRQSVLFLSGNVDDFDMVGRRESLAPMWKHLGKHIEMAYPTPLPTQVYLG